MSLVRAERIGPITLGRCEWKMAMNRVSDSTFSSKITSASDSDHCGRAPGWLSTFTASAGTFSRSGRAALVSAATPGTPGNGSYGGQVEGGNGATVSGGCGAAVDDGAGAEVVVVVAGADVVVVVAGSVVGGDVVVRAGAVVCAAVVSGSLACVVVPAESFDPLAHAGSAARMAPARIR